MLFYPKICWQKTTLVRLNPDSRKFGLSRFRRTLLFRKIRTFVLNKFELPSFKVLHENYLSKFFSSFFVYLTHFWKEDFQIKIYFIISNDEIFKDSSAYPKHISKAHHISLAHICSNFGLCSFDKQYFSKNSILLQNFLKNHYTSESGN